MSRRINTNASCIGGGKGKGKLLEDVRDLSYREPNESKFPGAIKKNRHVLAVMRDNKTWCIAKILEIRKQVKVEELKNSDSTNATEKNPEVINSYHRNSDGFVYEYYVTYLEHERRNDRWVPEICLRIDEEWVNQEINRLDD